MRCLRSPVRQQELLLRINGSQAQSVSALTFNTAHFSCPINSLVQRWCCFMKRAARLSLFQLPIHGFAMNAADFLRQCSIMGRSWMPFSRCMHRDLSKVLEPSIGGSIQYTSPSFSPSVVASLIPSRGRNTLRDADLWLSCQACQPSFLAWLP